LPAPGPRAELEVLLASAPSDAGRADYRRLVLDENVLGKRSLVTREKLWQRLRERYLLEPAVAEFALFRAAMLETSGAAERGLLCLLMVARADRLFREVTVECVSPHIPHDGVGIDPAGVQAIITRLVAGAGAAWTPDTTEHVRQHVLSSLKDFGVLRGSRDKRTVRPRPGIQATLFAARLGRLTGLTDRQNLDSCWFRLLGQGAEGAVGLLYAAARAGALRFDMQAGVVELTLPDAVA
jgi:hypothetical protein